MNALLLALSLGITQDSGPAAVAAAGRVLTREQILTRDQIMCQMTGDCSSVPPPQLSADEIRAIPKCAAPLGPIKLSDLAFASRDTETSALLKQIVRVSGCFTLEFAKPPKPEEGGFSFRYVSPRNPTEPSSQSPPSTHRARRGLNAAPDAMVFELVTDAPESLGLGGLTLVRTAGAKSEIVGAARAPAPPRVMQGASGSGYSTSMDAVTRAAYINSYASIVTKVQETIASRQERPPSNLHKVP